ncbi:MAG: peptide MFS transporter, partial [Gammaproteobacteria bacterium]
FKDSPAYLTWGAAAALIYVSPAIGGWVGDKFLGTRHTMLLGACVLTVGYALMVVPSASSEFLFLALGVIVVGNGLFKANAGNLVRKIYEGDDTKIDSAFTIYYMAVNIGSMVSMLLTPFIKTYFNAPFHGQLTWLLGSHAAAFFGDNLGWHIAFAVSCVGLLVGLGNYAVMRHTLNHIGSEPDHQPFRLWKLLAVLAGGIIVVFISAFILKYGNVARIFVYVAGACVVAIFAYLIAKCRHGEKAGLIIALILVVETVFFFIFYQQMSTSLNVFALRNVNQSFNVFGFHLWTWDPAQFQAFNPIWIFILSPILAFIYTHFARRSKDLSIAAKFALGFAAVAVGFFVYGASAHFLTGPGKTTSWVMVWGYGFGSLGELLTSGLGLAFIARYVPARMGGFMMGAYFVAVGVSQYLGGIVANFASVPSNITDPVQMMPIYTKLFNALGVAGIICTVIALAVLPLIRKLNAEHHEHNSGVTPVPAAAHSVTAKE